MILNPELLLILFVGVTVLTFLVQCFAIWRAARSVKELTDRVHNQTSEMEGKIQIIQDRVLGLTAELQPLQQTAKELSGTIEVLSGRLKTRSQEIDGFVSQLMDVGREQASKIDYVVQDTLQKFEETTSVIQKDLLRPTVEISAFVKGVKAGLDALLSRPQAQPKDAVAEEQLFI